MGLCHYPPEWGGDGTSIKGINTYIYIYAQRLGFAQGANPRRINYHQPGYQLSSTIRVSTIINYQGISYHQLSGYQLSSTIRVSTIINYQLSGYQVSSNTTFFLSKFPPPPLLATNAFKDLQIQHSFYQNFPPPPLATNAFNDFQIQHYFYQNFPPPLWQPMHSMIFKYNIFLIKMFPPPPLLATSVFNHFQIQHSIYHQLSGYINYHQPGYQLSSTIRVSTIINYQLSGYQLSSNTTFFLSKFHPPPPSLGNQCFQGSSNTTFFLSKFPPPPLWQPMHSMIFKYNMFLIKIFPPPPLLATSVFNHFQIQHSIYHQLSGYINYHQPGYQLSSTIRVSTIINYQLSGYQLSSNTTFFLSKFHPPPPLLATNAFKDLQIQHSFYQNFPPPLLATNAFKDLQIQHSFYQNFPPPLATNAFNHFQIQHFLIKFSPPPPSLGNQCIQSFSNPTFFLSKFPPPLSWQPMLSRIFKSNILFIKISPPPSLGNQCFQ